MREVVAIVRINRMNQTKQALSDVGIDSFFAREAQGRGKGFVNPIVLKGAEQGYEEAAEVLGEKGKLYPKRMITVVVEEADVEKVVNALMAANQTGMPGDGKIFVMPVRDAIRVRTAETGVAAIS